MTSQSNIRKNSPSPSAVIGIILGFLFAGLLVIGGVWGYLNRQIFLDYYLGSSYVPSSDMSEIRSALKLTREGERIFNASHPTLEAKEDFNANCESYNPSIAIYGCYRDGRIHIYSVKIDELPGFLEATTAHEFLHAAWERLSEREHSALEPLLRSAYSENKETLEESLENYPESQFIDELYVRLAVQTSELPLELESHYSRFLSDRGAIVAFYDSYIAPFNKINAEIAAQKTELDHLKTEIDSKTRTYDQRSLVFSGSVANFNSCANTRGCYSSEATFNSDRAALVAEQKELSNLYAEIERLIDDYNAKVAVYNSNILLSNTLQQKTNSNAPPASDIETNE